MRRGGQVLQTHDHICREVLELPDRDTIESAASRARIHFDALLGEDAGCLHFKVKQTVGNPTQWIFVALCEVNTDAEAS